jgi:hypothetical protein
MTSKMLKAMMEAQKRAKMKPYQQRAKMSSVQKVVYVPPARATIKNQEANAAA